MTAIPTASWRNFLDELRRSDAALFRSWLYDLDAPLLAGGVLTIRVRNNAQQAHLERFSSLLSQNAQAVLGRLVSVRVETGAEVDPGPESMEGAESQMGPDYRLDRFVVTPENQLAHAAATKAMEMGAPFNPLFVHGPLSSGKSHLLRGLCAEVSAIANGEGDSVYRITRDFVAEFTQAFESGLAGEFRKRYVQARLVALDDVEELAGKSRSQEELFHILNARVESGRPLVLAADRPPATIQGLSERLVSRFTAGLVLAMDAPGEETRLRILRQKNADANYEFSDELLEAVARRCTAGDLDTILPRIDALAASQDGPISMELVETVLRGRMVEAGVA